MVLTFSFALKPTIWGGLKNAGRPTCRRFSFGIHRVAGSIALEAWGPGSLGVVAVRGVPGWQEGCLASAGLGGGGQKPAVCLGCFSGFLVDVVVNSRICSICLRDFSVGGMVESTI